MTMSHDYRARQERQVKDYQAWAKSQGTVELPTRLSTMVQPRQVFRMNWLKEHRLGNALEVGSNIGLVLAWTGCDGTGLDISPACVDLARILVPECTFIQGNALALPFEDRSFMTVMLPEILEHLDWTSEVPRALQEAVRVARRRVLITIPDGREDTTDACCFKHRWLCDGPHLGAILSILRGYGGRPYPETAEGFALINCILDG